MMSQQRSSTSNGKLEDHQNKKSSVMSSVLGLSRDASTEKSLTPSHTESGRDSTAKLAQKRSSLSIEDDDYLRRRSYNPLPPKDKAYNNNAQDDQKDMKSTFIDAEAMKEKVRQNLMKPQHRAQDAYKKKGMWQAIARSVQFEYVSLAVVALNALWIAIDTDNNSSDLLLDAHPVFIVAENMFCFCFFTEWLVKFLAYQRKVSGLKDSWFVFDSLLVFMMVMETWVMSLVILALGGAGGIGGNASILRIARLLRLSRMARMARLLRALPELMIMIRGMVAAARSVFFTLCLLIIVLYVFAIAFTQLCVETQAGSKYFNTVPESMFTLLIYGTLLDNIGAFANELGKEAFYINILFFLFVLIAALTIMNMLIGVLCEVVNAVAATEKEEMLVTYVNQKLQRVVSLLDTDGGGTISKKEFLQILDNIDAVRCLNDVGVDVIGLVDFVDFIFETDEDVEGDEENEVELDFGKFMDVVLQLRGCNNATVKDVVDLRKLVKKSAVDIKGQMAQILHQMEITRKSLCPSKVSESDKNGIHNSHESRTSRAPAAYLKTLDENQKVLMEKVRHLPDPIKHMVPKQSSSSWEVLEFFNSSSKEMEEQICAHFQNSLQLFDGVESDSIPAPVQQSVPTLLLRPDEFDEATSSSVFYNELASPLLSEVMEDSVVNDKNLVVPNEHIGNGTRV